MAGKSVQLGVELSPFVVNTCPEVPSDPPSLIFPRIFVAVVVLPNMISVAVVPPIVRSVFVASIFGVIVL